LASLQDENENLKGKLREMDSLEKKMEYVEEQYKKLEAEKVKS